MSVRGVRTWSVAPCCKDHADPCPIRFILCDGKMVAWAGTEEAAQFIMDACNCWSGRVRTLEEWFDQADPANHPAPPDVLAALAPYPTHLPRPEDVTAVSAYAWRAPLLGVPIDAPTYEDVE